MSALITSLVAFPLAGFLAIALLRPSNRVAGYIATTSVALAFGAAAIAFLTLVGMPAEERSITPLLWGWVRSGGLDANVQFLYDPLSALMALIVTGISMLVHLYSIEYMAGDRSYRRYFAVLNLFVAMMLLLVLAANYLLLLVGWAGVGLSSYLLIGHWRERPGVAGAAVKAFVINTIGDLGLLLAMFIMVTRLGSLSYTDVLGTPRATEGVAFAIVLCLLVAAAAKSAQLPLQVWLPDAMAGPTPVSALIHAATMVTAGVYLMARSAPLLSRSSNALLLVATVGALTALVGALAATSQTNIKRVLAYSTVSQLGYMFLGIGVGAYGAGLFHLYTHSLYKACLFLGAGVVIHALHNEETMQRMGGLRTRIEATCAAMIVGAAALAGLPPFAGFWSKDEVLVAAFYSANGSPLLGVIALLTGGLTGYYAFRLILLTFFGEPRSVGEIHRPSPLLWAPVVFLGVLSFVGGLPPIGGAIEHFLEPVWNSAAPYEASELGSAYWVVSIVAALVALTGAGVAVGLHLMNRLPAEARGSGVFLLEGLYFDRLYAAVILRPSRAVGLWASSVFESGVVDNTVLGVGRAARDAGESLSEYQSGYLRSYAMTVLIGAVVLLGYLLWVIR